MSLQFCLSRSRHHRLLGEPCQESAWTGRMQAAYLRVGGRPGVVTIYRETMGRAAHDLLRLSRSAACACVQASLGPNGYRVHCHISAACVKGTEDMIDRPHRRAPTAGPAARKRSRRWHRLARGRKWTWPLGRLRDTGAGP